METRIAVIGIIVEDMDSVAELNEILHDYSQYVIGRMGIPYLKRGINIISVAVDAPQDAISALSGSIGRLTGISVKTAYSNVVSES
ncbi:TM1266 family iron-only hydrogenase system putative regulator [Loigolactobacillus binensis]|uniref:TM1266 family iron-only hydrogenase system putative regulator n=1 Tax=Loigolactobacillus binensis TaxID=2559922 RepID=UPI0010F8A1E5|nr:TM1266 family iron-only hydrogenase system putative regulator [Loigolactobacillus binensis]